MKLFLRRDTTEKCDPIDEAGAFGFAVRVYRGFCEPSHPAAQPERALDYSGVELRLARCSPFVRCTIVQR